MRITYTPTISASPDYSIGDAYGSNAVSLTPLPFGRTGCKVTSVYCQDVGNQGPSVILLFFKSDPEAAATPATITDNAAFAWGTADTELLCVGRVEVDSANWATLDSVKHQYISDIEGVLINPGEALNVLAIVNSAHNAGSTSDLSFLIGLEPM